MNDLFSNGFSYFLYWSNLLHYPKLDNLLQTIIEINKNIVIQIDIDILEQDICFMQKLQEKYKSKISFLFSNNIFTEHDLLKMFVIVKMLKKSWLRINFDLVLNITKFHDDIKAFLLNFHKVWIDKIHRNIYFIEDNISWTFTQSIKIDHGLQAIHGIKYKHCVMNDFFTIKEKKIYISSHIEVTKEWNLTFHTPLCFLTNITVSSYAISYDKILNNFIEFNEKFIAEKKSDNMWSTCYDCITSKGYSCSL